MTQLVMFDLDGTLVDSAADIAATVNDVLQKEALPQVPAWMIRTWIGYGARHTLSMAYAHSLLLAQSQGRQMRTPRGVLPNRLMYEYTDSHAIHCGRLSVVYPEVLETLRKLHESSLALAVVTNKEEGFARQLLERTGLTRWFATVVCGDTLPRKKPDPAPLRHCMSLHSVAAADAVMVGDSPIDALAAKHAGVRMLLVRHGYDSGVPARDATVIQSFADLLDAI